VKDKKIEALGFFAGLMTSSSFAPQVYTLWRMAPKPAPDVSLSMYVFVVGGVALWVAYGFKIRSWAIKVWNLITFVLALSVLIYKFVYG
jgi:MtN3 and saliva related transmembrane protein